MNPFAWTCPFCNRPVTITDASYQERAIVMRKDGGDGKMVVSCASTICPNPDCGKLTFGVALNDAIMKSNGEVARLGDAIDSWRLIPASSAKVLPDYLPQPIVADYQEACAILELSPKASATLSRRCLQGMIRNFFGVSKARLIEEINAIKDQVAPDTWDAIDAVRSIGNIGAHMEKDINVIIDVDAGEAAHLIRLIEILVDDWYVLRYERQKRLGAIKAIADAKQEQKNGTAQR